MKTDKSTFKKLSIIIPVYNEERTVEKLVEAVLAVPLELEKELVIVDDCSKDNTFSIISQLKENHPSLRVSRNEKNRGKGFSVSRGIDEASGDIIIIQDADLEYDPNEYPKLLAPILQGNADVVYGSRFATAGPKRVLYFWHYIGNKILTLFSYN